MPPQVASNSQRSIGLDLLRIALAFFIFFFHSRIHLHCEYGVLNYFFDSPNLGMIGFFMLSGYSLQLAYHHKELTEGRNIKEFLLKRFVSIYPLYIVVGLLSVIMLIGAGKQTVVDNIFLLPVELLGIQSFFDGSLFSYAHNSGTWFVSCIIICYICFPFLKGFAKKMAIKNAVWLLVAILCLLVYVHYLPAKYECGIYIPIRCFA